MNKHLRQSVLAVVMVFSFSAIAAVCVAVLENIAAMATGYVSLSQIFYSVSAMVLESVYIYVAADVCRKAYGMMKGS